MRNLELMIQMNQSTLEERRRELALILEEETSLENKIKQLDKDLIKEQEFTKLNNKATFYYDNFAKLVRARKKVLNHDLSTIQMVALKAREQVNEAFLELRKYEITNENIEKEEQIEMSRLEQIELDDISIGMFSRKEVEF